MKKYSIVLLQTMQNEIMRFGGQCHQKSDTKIRRILPLLGSHPTNPNY